MSNPETPCHTGCQSGRPIGSNAEPVTIHAPACPNAPKAEAPPAPKPEEPPRLGGCEVFGHEFEGDDDDCQHCAKPDACQCGSGCDPGECGDIKPAQPANVSEGPIDPIEFAAADRVAEYWSGITSRTSGTESLRNMARAYLDLKAQNAALQEAHDHAQEGLKSARKQEGEMREKIAALTAEVEEAECSDCYDLRKELERMRDLIVDATCNFGACVGSPHASSLCSAGRAIHASRAAREEGKA